MIQLAQQSDIPQFIWRVKTESGDIKYVSPDNLDVNDDNKLFIEETNEFVTVLHVYTLSCEVKEDC